MLKVIISTNKLQAITLDDLYQRTKELGMRLKIDTSYWLSGTIQVELCYKNNSGSSFTFVGKSIESLNEAFLNAFKEAEVIGIKL